MVSEASLSLRCSDGGGRRMAPHIERYQRISPLDGVLQRPMCGSKEGAVEEKVDVRQAQAMRHSEPTKHVAVATTLRPSTTSNKIQNNH